MHSKTGRRRRRLAIGAAASLVATGLAIPLVADATPSGDSGFEGQDGNLTPDTTTDWNSFDPVSWEQSPVNADPAYQVGTSAADGWVFFGLTDATATNSDTAFSGGTKQDDYCASTKGAKAPNKDDLVTTYLTSKTVNDDIFVGLAWTRIPQNSTTASAHVAFEFNQGDTGCGGGSPLVEREPGDVLIVYDFEGGNAAPTLKLSRWLELGAAYDGLCEVTGNPPVGADAAGCWGNTVDITGFAEAAVNVGAAVTDELPPAGTTPRGLVEFGEAIINLTDAGVFQPGQCLALGSLFAVSRSSGNSAQAQMKDLVGPGEVNLSNCGQFTIVKELTAGETPQAGDDLVDFPYVVSPAAGDPSTTGFSLNIGDSNAVTNVQPGSYSVTETVPTGWNLDSVSCTGGGDSPITDGVSLAVVADSDITCTFYNSRQRGSIQVEKLVAGTSTRIDGATFALDDDGDPTTTDDQTDIPSVSGETGLYCVDDLLFGDYNVVETSPPTGYTGDSDVEVVSVSTESTCGERATDSVDASFQNQAIPTIVTAAQTPVTVGATINDTATLSGGYNPTGTITFTAYSDDTCSTQVFTDDVTVNGNGNYVSDDYTTTAAGPIYWIASYSGDVSNTSATGGCGDEGETSVVNPATPTIVTAAQTPVTVGATINDTATLSGGYNPTGTITFTAYSDDTCSTQVFTDDVTVNGNGNYVSDDYTTTAAGPIYWIASYSGDGNNIGVSGSCGDEGETSIVNKDQPLISTTPVLLPNDTATLSGGFGSLVGSITFELHATADCSGTAIYDETLSVSGAGDYSTSNTTVFITADGTYSWYVSYTGDGDNEPAVSACNAEQQVIDFTPLAGA